MKKTNNPTALIFLIIYSTLLGLLIFRSQLLYHYYPGVDSFTTKYIFDFIKDGNIWSIDSFEGMNFNLYYYFLSSWLLVSGIPIHFFLKYAGIFYAILYTFILYQFGKTSYNSKIAGVLILLFSTSLFLVFRFIAPLRENFLLVYTYLIFIYFISYELKSIKMLFFFSLLSVFVFGAHAAAFIFLLLFTLSIFLYKPDKKLIYLLMLISIIGIFYSLIWIQTLYWYFPGKSTSIIQRVIVFDESFSFTKLFEPGLIFCAFVFFKLLFNKKANTKTDIFILLSGLFVSFYLFFVYLGILPGDRILIYVNFLIGVGAYYFFLKFQKNSTFLITIFSLMLVSMILTISLRPLYENYSSLSIDILGELSGRKNLTFYCLKSDEPILKYHDYNLTCIDKIQNLTITDLSISLISNRTRSPYLIFFSSYTYKNLDIGSSNLFIDNKFISSNKTYYYLKNESN